MVTVSLLDGPVGHRPSGLGLLGQASRRAPFPGLPLGLLHLQGMYLLTLLALCGDVPEQEGGQDAAFIPGDPAPEWG